MLIQEKLKHLVTNVFCSQLGFQSTWACADSRFGRYESIFGKLEVGPVALVVGFDLKGPLEAVDGLVVLLHARVGQAHAAVGFAVTKEVEMTLMTLMT